eukprot:11938365-Ditylum_brightwellii.AAC.1
MQGDIRSFAPPVAHWCTITRYTGLLADAPCDTAIKSPTHLCLEIVQLVFHRANQGQWSNARQRSTAMSAHVLFYKHMERLCANELFKYG